MKRDLALAFSRVTEGLPSRVISGLAAATRMLQTVRLSR